MMKPHLAFSLLGSMVFVVGCGQSDPGITTHVKTRLMADAGVNARHINVDTHNRVVTLTGTVHSAEEETTALHIARNTKGVSDVVDNLTITSSELGAAPTTGRFGDIPPVTSATETLTDAGITARVKATLLADPNVSGLRIDVDTRDRTVTLNGTVNSAAEKARAVELSERVENVIRVEDHLKVRR